MEHRTRKTSEVKINPIGQPGISKSPDSNPYHAAYSQNPAGNNVPPVQKGNSDPESLVQRFDFSEISVRRGFIRKVYSILMCQLSVTVGIIALFIYQRQIRDITINNAAVPITALVVLVVTFFTMMCCVNIRRKIPWNYIFLTIFTLAESFFLGVFAAVFAPQEVLFAIAATVIVCLALTIFSFQTRIDFTFCNGFMFVVLIIFLLFGSTSLVMFYRLKEFQIGIIYSAIGAMLFSILLIIDTQMIIGGTHSLSISPEEYLFAALTLYLDIVRIFIYILACLGIGRRS